MESKYGKLWYGYSSPTRTREQQRDLYYGAKQRVYFEATHKDARKRRVARKQERQNRKRGSC